MDSTDPLEKTDWVTLDLYIMKICAAQGYENAEEFMKCKWAKPLVSLYGDGKIRAYAMQVIEKLRGVK